MSSRRRLQCRDCGAHTTRMLCGNCLSRDLGPIDAATSPSPVARAALAWRELRVATPAGAWAPSRPSPHF